MKIGLVLSSVPGYSETFFRNKIKGLQAHGFEVVLFVNDLQPTDLPCNIVRSIPFNGKPMTAFYHAITALFKCVFVCPKQSLLHYRLDQKHGFSLLARLRRLVLNQRLLAHRVDWLHFGFGMLAVGREHVAESIGAKMAVSFRGFDLYLSPLKHPGCYDLLFQKQAHYHVLSHGMKQTLTEHHIQPNNITVIPPAIDTNFFVSDKQRQTPTVLQLVTVARLHWIKGLDYTLQAMALLKSQNVPFHYTIIGDGDQLERLTFTAHQLGISDCVTFMGKLPQEHIKSHLQQSDIYVQYSIQEGFCNAVLEAQAMGLLCIVSNAEGLEENVLDQQTGWVVPKRQPKALAEKILEVSQLPNSQKQSIREAAVCRVKNHFHLEQQQVAFVKFYEDF